MRNWGGAALCGAALLVPQIVTAAPQRPDSLSFTVVAPHAVRRGEPVPIRLRLTNTGARTLNLYLTGRTITFDIIVARSDGQVVWRRLEHVTSQQIVHVKTLAPVGRSVGMTPVSGVVSTVDRRVPTSSSRSLPLAPCLDVHDLLTRDVLQAAPHQPARRTARR